MTDLLAIISKAVFEKTSPRAAVGTVLDLDRYVSTHKALEPLREGGRLFLVTVRPPDEQLWLVAVLERPRHDGKAWVAKKNVHPVSDLSSVRSRIRFTSNSGISATKGALGMSLQTPRQLTPADVELMLGSGAATKPESRAAKQAAVKPARVSAPKRAPAPTPAPATATASIIEGRMEQAIGAMRELTATATASVVPELMRWLDLDKWRSTEATSFWVSVFFLLMRFGEEEQLKALRRASPHKSYSQMHEWLTRCRKLVAQVIELRARPQQRAWSDEPLPKTRAQVMAHIAKRLGDPRWKQARELVAFAQKPSFSLQGEEGLHVFAALLLHADASDLEPLKGLARQEPIFAQILSSHGSSSGEHELGQRLREAVLAEPSNDHPRAVYADWLMEQGDPRGEFIAAQLARRPAPLDVETAVAWAGAVRSKLRWRSPFANEKGFHVPRYTRGFLSGAAVDSLDGAAAASPDWATLEVLDVHSGDLDGLGRYDLRSLVVLGGLQAEDLDTVLAQPLGERLLGVGLRASATDEAVCERLARFPRLRFLAWDGPTKALFAHPLVDRLELLAVNEDTRVPKSIRPTVLGTHLYAARWLPHFDELQKRLRPL
ncbi:MAG: TIGR02996 domain-containing protein [Myxococcales bacterium]|nr:TIGR02996 domain-containing protein [Myxococcales bacterium]